MRLILATAVICCVCLLAAARTVSADSPPDLAKAREAYQRNIALGEPLDGEPATQEQATEAEELIQEGLDCCRAYLKTDSRLAEAHRLAGVLLCLTYRPAEVRTITTDEETGELREGTIIVLRRGSKNDAEEGLAELRAALRLARNNADYQLDYAEALQVCGRCEECAEQATAIWERRSSLSGDQGSRAAALLAEAMSSLDRPGREAHWLREALLIDPANASAAHRLAELGPALHAGIAWEPYEAGMAIAGYERRPAFIDFSASWCGWCEKLEREVFSRRDAIALSREFACIKVDGDRRRDLVRSYRVEGYPTAVFLDANGREVHRIVGYRPADQYLAEMGKALPPEK